MTRCTLAVATTWIVLVAGDLLMADTLHVPGDFASIQSAIDAAANGDEVDVAPGTYNETLDMLGKAIELRSESGADVTTIDATGLENTVILCDKGEGPGTIIDGFTITGGIGAEIEVVPGTFFRQGGGMYNAFSSPTVKNCAFIGNIAANGGGGIYNEESHADILSCSFMGNDGAAISNRYESLPTIIDCDFESNTAFSGAGIFNQYGSNPLISGCRFVSNIASSDGGGITNLDVSEPTIVNTLFLGNQAGWAGGGVTNHNIGQTLLVNCVFLGNTADTGAGIASLWDAGPTVINCTFYGNEARVEGGGMMTWINSSTPTFVANSVFWNNKPDQFVEEVHHAPVTVTRCNIQGGWPGDNIDAEPMFIDPAGADGVLGTLDDDVRVQPGSPCVDAGDNSAVPPEFEFDLDGLARFRDDPFVADSGIGDCPIVDMGAYEFQSILRDCTLAIASSDPPNDAIDARQPSEPNGSNPAGWDEMTLTFSADTSAIDVDDFSVASDPPGAAPVIDELEPIGTTLVVRFVDRIPLGHWTILTYDPTGQSVRIGFLPADVNSDKTSSVGDVLELINFLNGQSSLPIYSTDIDRSGVASGADVLRTIDLLNGSDTYDEWNLEQLPN